MDESLKVVLDESQRRQWASAELWIEASLTFAAEGVPGLDIHQIEALVASEGRRRVVRLRADL